MRTICIPSAPGMNSLCSAFLLAEAGRKGLVTFSSDIDVAAIIKEPGKDSVHFTSCAEVFHWVANPARWFSLTEYCQLAHDMVLPSDQKYIGSLKWAIMQLREGLAGGNDLIWEAFRYLAWNATNYARGCDSLLYRHPVHGRIFAGCLNQTVPDWHKWVRIEQINHYTVAISEGDRNVTSMVFKDPSIDILVFRNHIHDWAGYVVRSKERRPDVDLSDVRKRLPPDEPWFLHPSGNVLLCGGLRVPMNMTNLSINELLAALSGSLSS